MCNASSMTIYGSGDADRWDFFISYTQTDRRWAEWIAWELEESGWRVLVQAWDFVPGSNWIQGMQTGVSRADRMIAVLSENYLESVFGGAEWQAVWAIDPQGKARRVLPVRVSDCDRPGLLAGVVGVDLFGVSEAKARTRLREMVARAEAGRAKPRSRPSFPAVERAMPVEARFPGALPSIWEVPARNPHFTGRTADLGALVADLASGGTVTVQSVRGMGGVGKTHLATEYAYRRATSYDLVWWIPAEEPALIPDQFARLAGRLGVDAEGDPDAVREAVHERLRSVSGWLLIFDNAEQVDAIRSWLPSAPLPAGIPGHVIVTTRKGGFGALGRVHDLDVVDLGEAVQLMRARVPGLAEPIAQEIAAGVGRLPLALDQAAAYLDRTDMDPRDYLTLLRTRMPDLYFRPGASEQDQTVATVWTLSFEQVTRRSRAAAQLLDVCAYLAPEPIPLDLFTAHPDELPEPLATAVADTLAFTDVLTTIVDFSLAKRTSDGLQLHRLVQAALRSRHTPVGGGDNGGAGR
jgi:hypothetical protein